MKNVKRIFALLIVFTFIFNIFNFHSIKADSAQGAESAVIIEIGNVEGYRGDTIKVPIYLKNVTGKQISNMDFWIMYDAESFNFKQVTYGSLVQNTKDFDYYTMLGSQLSRSDVKQELITKIGVDNLSKVGLVSFMYADESKNDETPRLINQDGLFAELYLQVKQEAKVGFKNISVFYIGSVGLVETIGGVLQTIKYDVQTIDGQVNIKVHAESVSLNYNKKTIKVGESFSLVATVLPEDATNKEVVWESSNSNVATVDANGKVTAKGVGTATITVKTVDGGYTASCEVTVEPIRVSGVSLDITSKTVKIGESFSLVATVLPEDATNKEVLWTSSDESVAIVDSTGKVTAKGAGEAIITVKTVDGGYTATCKVYVVNDENSFLIYINGRLFDDFDVEKDYYVIEKQGTPTMQFKMLDSVTVRVLEYSENTGLMKVETTFQNGKKKIYLFNFVDYKYDFESDIKDGQITVSAITNKPNVRGILFIVQYDQNGNMIKLDTNNILEGNTITLRSDILQNTKTIKYFVLDSLDTLKALSEIETREIN